MAKDYGVVAEKYGEYVNRIQCNLCPEDQQKEFGDRKDMFRHLLQKHRKNLTKAELEAE